MSWQSASSSELAGRLRSCANLLGVDFPLVQAGMGGLAGPELAAAVSSAGALGTVALYKADGNEAEALVRATGRLTPSTFSVNVIPEVAHGRLQEQLAAIETLGRGVVVNSYGLPPDWFADRVRSEGHLLLVQVGTPSDARSAEQLGAAVIALQGIEAGGHLLGNLPLRALLSAVLDQGTAVPLVAAGGIATGSEAAQLALQGASGWLCGTRFAATAESAAHPLYKDAIVTSTESDTVITDRFAIGWPGRRHRVLASRVTRSEEALPATFVAWTTIAGGRLPVPRGSAAAPTVETEGTVEEMAMYAGTAVGDINDVPRAGQVVRDLRAEVAHVLPVRASLAPAPC